MESLNDFYDIESPRVTEKKIETIENSIHHSLLYNNERTNNYNIYNYFLKILLWVIAIGILAFIIVVVLLVINKMS
jgi:hypothetical protein